MEIDEEFYILEQEVYTKKDLRRFLAEGISLEYADLKESELIGANIPKLNLTGANLQGADLRGTNLSECDDLNLDQFYMACGNVETLGPPGIIIPDCEPTRY